MDLTNMLEMDMDDLKAAMREDANGPVKKSPFWRMTSQGSQKIRIIPRISSFGERTFYQKRLLHFIEGHGSFLCLRQTLTASDGTIHEAEASCPICDLSKKLYATSHKGEEAFTLAGKLRAKERYVCRVVVRGRKDEEGKDVEPVPVFWEFGTKIFTYFATLVETNEAGNFLSLKNGYDFILTKTGEKINTDYSASTLSRTSSPVVTSKDALQIFQTKLDDMKYSTINEFKTAEEMKQAIAETYNTGSTPATTAAPVSAPVVQSSVNTSSNEADPLDPFSQVGVNTEKKEENIDDLLGELENFGI